MDLMWFLLLAHLTGDYALQSDRMAAEKGQCVSALTWHVAMYTACIAFTLWGYSTITAKYEFLSPTVAGLVPPLFALHWIQDYIKSRKFANSKQAYYVDQVLHLTQLYAIRLLAM